MQKSIQVFCCLCMISLFSVQAMAQSRTVSGTVISAEDGQPLPGVTVLIQSTDRGTTTNPDGEFRLDIPESAEVLFFSFVGYRSQEVNIQGRSEVNVSLETDVQMLSDVVVVGYGSQIKEKLTGSISSVGGEELENVTVNSFESALQGRSAGVFVQANNGKLGQGIKVRVRGSSSVTASNQPLYVIDGIPITTENQAHDNSAPTNPLADLNYADIESIEILKDASASAIYGSRASNGVVLITTKTGKAGRTNVEINLRQGVSTPTNKRDWLNTEEYIELFTESLTYAGFSQEDIENTFTSIAGGEYWRNGEVDVDWQDEAFQNASATQLDASVSGGSEKTRFYLGGSYSDEAGILINNNFERISGRLNLDHTINDRFDVGFKVNLGRTVNDRLADDNEFATPIQLVAQPPISPVYVSANGPDEPYEPSDELSEFPLYFNGLLYKDNVKFQTRVFRSFSNAYANYKILPNLSFRSEFGIDLLNQNEEQYQNSKVAGNIGVSNGFGRNRWVQVFNYTTNNFFTYQDIFAERHDIEIVGGMSFQAAQNDITFIEGQEFPNDFFQQIDSAADITGGGSSETEYSFLSYFSRVNYSLDDTYLLTLSARVDGSSRFGEDNRYGFFPAASVGWILTNESFLEGVGTLSFLKLRASYGLTGNAEIDNFSSRGLYQGRSYAGVPGTAPSQMPNPDLKWEQTAQADIGIDFGLFDDRISGEIDYYIKNTDDLLLDVNIPGSSGFESQLQNVGSLENKGFEFVLNTVNLVGEFGWNTSFNVAINVNEITDLDEQIIEGGYINRAVEGEPIGAFFAQEYAGVNPDNGDAVYFLNREPSQSELDNGTVFQYESLWGDRYITADYNTADRVVIGNPNPDFMGGLTNSLYYKGFDLGFTFQFVYGNDIYNGGGEYQSASGDYFDNQSRDQLDRWQEPGDITDVPQARYLAGNGTGASSRYLSEGSFIRLKTLNFGYTLPQDLLSRISVRDARIYISGTNLLTFTGYDGWDPEVTTDYLTGNLNLGNDFYAAPQARTISLGLKLGL